MRELFSILQQISKQLDTLITIGGDLVSTSRFQRGGYDGPFLRPRVRVIGQVPVEIHAGHEYPTALLIEVLTGTGINGETLQVSDDRGAMQGGYVVDASAPISLAAGNPLRVMADRNQRMFARFAGEGTIEVRVREGRL